MNNLNEEEFKKYLDQLLSLLGSQTGKVQKLSLPTVDGVDFITITDILRCQSNGGYTDIFLKNNKQQIITRRISDIEIMLKKFPFYRIHRSHLINVNFVKSFKRSSGIVTMENGEELPVSRRKKEEFLTYLRSF